MKEGDMLFESGVGKTLDGKWWWRARGLYVVEFCRTYTPEWQDVPDGHFPVVGPYKRSGQQRVIWICLRRSIKNFFKRNSPTSNLRMHPTRVV